MGLCATVLRPLVTALTKRDWRGAEASFKHAIKLDPSYPVSWQGYGACCVALGRLNEQYHVWQRPNPRRPLHGIVGVRALGRGILKAKWLDRIEDRRSEYGAGDRE